MSHTDAQYSFEEIAPQGGTNHQFLFTFKLRPADYFSTELTVVG